MTEKIPNDSKKRLSGGHCQLSGASTDSKSLHQHVVSSLIAHLKSLFRVFI